MAVAQRGAETKKIIADPKVMKAEESLNVQTEQLSAEMQHHQSIIKTYRYILQNLQIKLQEHLEAFQENEPLAVEAFWEEVQDISTVLIQYQLHFVLPFKRLLQRIRHYIELAIPYVTEADQRTMSEFLGELNHYTKLAQKQQDITDLLHEGLNEIIIDKDTFRPRPVVENNLRKLAPTAANFARRADVDVTALLSGINYVIDRARSLLQIGART